MKGIITIEVNNHKVDFDFENYRYGFSFNIDDREEDRLDIIGEIEADPDYQFLRKCLIAKHDFNSIPGSDPQKYRKVLDEYISWNLRGAEDQDRQEKQSV